MTRDPCPYCGMPGIALARVDPKTEEIVRDIKDHSCPEWAPKLPLSYDELPKLFDMMWNRPDAFERWRRSMR